MLGFFSCVYNLYFYLLFIIYVILGLNVEFNDEFKCLIKINYFWKISNLFFLDKGMVIDKNGLIYFVDGIMIRKVD